MSHQIHITKAIVIKLLPDGEESVIAECITADLGRIYVHVQGARKMQNRHRMMLYPFASIMLGCVQGKSYFRCTGIAERDQVYENLVNLTKERRALLRECFGMIQRLVPGGIPIPEVFSAYEFFVSQILDSNVSDQDTNILLLVAQLRILGILGYWNSQWSDEVLDRAGKTFTYVTENKRSVEKLIEKILVETQMTEKMTS